MSRNSKCKPLTKPSRTTPVVADASQDGQTQPAGYLDTLSEQMEAMTALFEKLSSNQHPDFMTVWCAISEMVAFYTEPRPISGGPPRNPKNMSQKKCRFCD